MVFEDIFKIEDFIPTVPKENTNFED